MRRAAATDSMTARSRPTLASLCAAAASPFAATLCPRRFLERVAVWRSLERSGNAHAADDPPSDQLHHRLDRATATVDIVDLRVPEYHTLDSIILNSYSGPSQSFLGLQQGRVWTAGTGGGVNPALLLGWTHFGPAASGAGVGQDLLDNLAVPKHGLGGIHRAAGPRPLHDADPGHRRQRCRTSCAST